MQFVSDQHEQTFDTVLHGLRRLGYGDGLLSRSYPFRDWFARGIPIREAPAAAFGRQPLAYDSACIAVLVPNGKAGPALVHDFRALGAPIALEVHEAQVVQWKVGPTLQDIDQMEVFPAAALDRVFRKQKADWSSDTILRAKALFHSDGHRQLDFIDLGLLPALEKEIQKKLDELLQQTIERALLTYRGQHDRDPDYQELYRLVFRCLAAKVLHDRGVLPFADSLESSRVDEVLDQVAGYYAEAPETVLQDSVTHKVVAEMLWTAPDFRNLSADTLAYIYESTLISKDTRKERGIHGTPMSLARYVVGALPFERVPADARHVVEPCCGHAVFLLAALQRLRDLVPTELTEYQRHRYLVNMLRGYDVDPFALEVGRLCLLLADFPNRNGWHLEREDVHRSMRFAEALHTARFVLCNPPFEDFAETGRHDNQASVHQPVALLTRIFEHLHPDGMLGFVLPRKLIDGAGYREVRRTLTTRFASLEVVSLPDNVFGTARMESALLIATGRNSGLRSTLRFSYVARADSQRFLHFHEPTWSTENTLTPEVGAKSFMDVPIPRLWEHLSSFMDIGSVADTHRGIEWKPSVPQQDRVSEKSGAGYELGLEKASKRISFIFSCPHPRYLLTKDSAIKPRSFDMWSFPKAVMNAARASQGIWCIVAFADHRGLITSQRFQNLWPKGYWTARALAAVLNGPVANIYLATRENKRDLHVETIRSIPLPWLTPNEIDHLDTLVAAYVQAMEDQYDAVVARQLLLDIDAMVLRGYRLPAELLNEILAFIRDHKRRVPFEFEYPADFAEAAAAPMLSLEKVSGASSSYELPEELLALHGLLVKKWFDEGLTPEEEAQLQSLRHDIHEAYLAVPAVQEAHRRRSEYYEQAKQELTDLLAELRNLER